MLGSQSRVHVWRRVTSASVRPQCGHRKLPEFGLGAKQTVVFTLCSLLTITVLAFLLGSLVLKPKVRREAAHFQRRSQM